VQNILMITSILGGENCAAVLARQLNLTVEAVSTRREGLARLRRQEYAVVIVDDALAEADPEGTELLWKHAGLAVPLQFNFAISGTARLVREIRAVLSRREQEQALAMRAAAFAVEGELRDTVTGLILHSQLALEEASITPQLTERLKTVAALAGTLREKLGSETPVAVG
jgi:CheY-like chemotaxis protein